MGLVATWQVRHSSDIIQEMKIKLQADLEKILKRIQKNKLWPIAKIALVGLFLLLAVVLVTFHLAEPLPFSWILYGTARLLTSVVDTDTVPHKYPKIKEV